MYSSSKSKYTQNVLTLVTGTAIAQAIPIAISPLLARIFSPEDFGVFALYLSVTSVVAAVSTGRLEFAITLPVDDEDAVQILWLSCFLTLFTSFVTLGIITACDDEIISLLGNRRIKPWLCAIPVTIFLSGTYSSFYYWFNRKKRFETLSVSRVAQTSGTSATNLSLGYPLGGGPLGLVIGNIIGATLSVVYFVVKFLSNPPLHDLRPRKLTIDAMVDRYQNFPKFDVPATFFNISSNQMVHVLFNAFFNAAVSGYYYFGQRLLNTPIALLGMAIQDVFKMEVIEVHNVNGDTRTIYLRTLKRLFWLAIIPTVLLILFAEEAFAVVFSEDWRPAGIYIQILTPAFFLRFIGVPLSYMIYVAEKQRINTIGQCLRFIAVIIAFLIGQQYGALTTIKLLSLVFSVFHVSYIYMCFKFTSHGLAKL